MDKPVIGPVVKPLAQPKRALEPAREKALVDRPSGIAIEEASGDQAVRVEHGDPERPFVRAAQRDEGAGRQRLRRRIHHHLVGIDPRVPALGAAMKAGQQGDLRPARRVIGCGRLLDRLDLRHALFPSAGGPHHDPGSFETALRASSG